MQCEDYISVEVPASVSKCAHAKAGKLSEPYEQEAHVYVQVIQPGQETDLAVALRLSSNSKLAAIAEESGEEADSTVASRAEPVCQSLTHYYGERRQYSECLPSLGIQQVLPLPDTHRAEASSSTGQEASLQEGIEAEQRESQQGNLTTSEESSVDVVASEDLTRIESLTSAS